MLKYNRCLLCITAILYGLIIIHQSQGGEGVTMTKNNAENYWVYFGTSGGRTSAMVEMNVPESRGVYVARFNVKDGTIGPVRLAAEMLSSGFLTIDRERNVLYVVGRRNSNDQGDSVYAYKIDPKTGDLAYMNHEPSGGKGICHVALSPDGKYVAAANYSSGDFSVLPVLPDGKVGPRSAFIKKEGHGPNKNRQDGPKGHAIYFFEHQGKYRIFMVDLGCDRVYIGDLDRTTGKVVDDPLIPVLQCPPGSGPRHLTWMENKDGSIIVFVLNELDSTVSVFRLNFNAQKADDALISFGAWSTIPEKLRTKLTDEISFVDGKKYLYGNKTAEIELFDTENGKVVYASNRGHNSIAIFDVNEFVNGEKKNPQPRLMDLQHTFGTFPRYFSTAPGGRFLFACNKKTGTVYLFTIDGKDGRLTPVNREPLRIAYAITMGFTPVEN